MPTLPVLGHNWHMNIGVQTHIKPIRKSIVYKRLSSQFARASCTNTYQANSQEHRVQTLIKPVRKSIVYKRLSSQFARASCTNAYQASSQEHRVQTLIKPIRKSIVYKRTSSHYRRSVYKSYKNVSVGTPKHCTRTSYTSTCPFKHELQLTRPVKTL